MDQHFTRWAVWVLALLTVGTARAATVDPSDANLQYSGRWDRSIASQPWAQAKGSTVIASFNGTSVAVTLTVVSGEYFRAIIEDDSAGSTQVQFLLGVPLTLAAGLMPGTHKLELVKETDEGRAILTGLEIDNGVRL